MQFKNLSLKLKILLPTFIVVAALMGISTMIMTTKAGNMAKTQAESEARSMARGYGKEISITMEVAMSITRTLATVFEQGAAYKTIPDQLFSSDFTNTSAGSKRRNWRSLAFAACSGLFILFFQS